MPWCAAAPGARRLLLDWGHPCSAACNWAGGDVLALMQANGAAPGMAGRVRSVAEDKAGRMVVELKRRRRCRRRGRWVAENLTLSLEVTVKRCVFRGKPGQRHAAHLPQRPCGGLPV